MALPSLPTFLTACLLGTGLFLQPSFTPARYQGGGPPALPAMAVGGGQVFITVTVGREGQVAAVSTVRSTPPYTQLVIDAVRAWQFTPATESKTDRDGRSLGSGPVESKVLVAATFRAPTLLTPTLGDAPKDVAVADPAVPFPTTAGQPAYNPLARGSGVVLVEALVSPDGKVQNARVIGSAPPFDSAALEAAWQWRFSPASMSQQLVPSYAYLLFGFAEPVTGH